MESLRCQFKINKKFYYIRSETGGDWQSIFSTTAVFYDFFRAFPSTIFGHSDRKIPSITGRQNKLLSVISWQIWVTRTASCDFFRKIIVTSLESLL
jgi:hypothetical protein